MPPPLHLPISTRVTEGNGNLYHTSASASGSDDAGSRSGSGSSGNNVGEENVRIHGGNNNIIKHSTPASSSHSSLGSPSISPSISSSGSSPFPPPAVDTRGRYEGFAFVFATDTHHHRKTVHGRGPVNSIAYLKPINEAYTTGSPTAFESPLFFTGFAWTDIDGRPCNMSRNEVCDAWQIGFNQLIYCASFLEEDTLNLEASDIEHFKREFEAWNDLFCELDQTLGRLIQCEIAHVLPQLHPPLPLAALANPQNVTNPQTPLNLLSATFLCTAREMLEKHSVESNRPSEAVRSIQENTEGWEPCTGYPVVQATQWGNSREKGGQETGKTLDTV